MKSESHFSRDVGDCLIKAVSLLCVLSHSVTQSCPTLCDPMDCSLPGSSVHGDSPGKNTGMGCHALLQAIFPTQRSNPGRLHCTWILYHLSHQESPRILEWVACPFSSRSSQPGNRTGVSCNCRRILHKLSYQRSLSLLLLDGITLVIPDPSL